MEPENKPSPLPAVLTAVLAIGIVAAVICLGLDFAVTMLAPRFEGRETITLSDRSGPDVGVAGSAAREEELDRLSLLVGMVYPHWEKEVEDPGSGPVVRVRVKTPLPWHTRRELRSIRRDYEAGDPWPEIRALAVGDYAKRPFGVEFDEPSAGVPVEPRLLRYARRIVASPREIVVPRLLEYALADPGDYAFEDGLDLFTVHALLCAALRVPEVPSTNAWQGVRLANERADFQGRTSDGWWGWWNDEPDRNARIASFWAPYRDALGSRAPRRIGDLVAGHHLVAHLGDYTAIDFHAAGSDELVGLTARADTSMGYVLVETHGSLGMRFTGFLRTCRFLSHRTASPRRP